jgi:fructose-specific phosphotransferase system IIC component
MRFLVALLAFLVSLVPTAAAAFFAVMFLAGPHGGVLPAPLHTATLALGWLLVLVIPALVARWAWRRYARSRP